MEGETITLGIIIGAALADSINPCVFGVLIFLIAFMQKVFKTRNRMLVGGLFYTAVVYATYLLIGFGLLKLLQDALPIGVSNAVYWVAAILAILAGLLEMKDFFAYGRGLTLQMIPGAAERLKGYTRKIETLYERHPKWSYLFVGLLGVFVVLVELPCTGAPYFAVINLLNQGDLAKGVPLLLLYNFIFIIPLFVIIGLSYFGGTDKIKAWKDKNKGAMRLGMGIVLIALGVYMIATLL
jgi:cytochrome c biogenesis protein CcdA